MKITIPAFCIATLMAIAPEGAAQKAPASKTGTRTLVEVPSNRPGVAPLTTRISCFDSIEDQATGYCLQASSTPTFGMLFPYPGDNNTFGGSAFVGGGSSNRAMGSGDTVGGGSGNIADSPRGCATIAGGRNNQATAADSTVGGGDGNTASSRFATVAGGTSNQATERWSTVGGGSGNTAYGEHATVGGGYSNIASYKATVGGGATNTGSGASATVGGGTNNTASGASATVGGGTNNTGSGASATVGGGTNNTASGEYATVGGGGGYFGNIASGDQSTVGGGYRNTASASLSTVGGGKTNTASGQNATVPGGNANRALGGYSFAAGRRAKANHDGAFVWGDSYSNSPLASLKTSSAPDEFNVYASGGVRMFTNSAATTGAALASGSGTWSMLSDRDSKENVEPVDAQAVLEGVVAMPLSTWNYTEQSDSVRHMGPMAQDFRAAFGLGVSDKLIDAVDSDGVALAAIQGLHAIVQEKDVEIAELRARLERLEALAMAR